MLRKRCCLPSQRQPRLHSDLGYNNLVPLQLDFCIYLNVFEDLSSDFGWGSATPWRPTLAPSPPCPSMSSCRRGWPSEAICAFAGSRAPSIPLQCRGALSPDRLPELLPRRPPVARSLL